MTVDQLREKLIEDVEEFYCSRSTYLMDYDLGYLDCLFEEFVVNGEEPDEWIFMNDMTNVS